MKKVMVIGASGTLGQAVLTELQADCQLISVGRHSGTHQMDITQPDTIAQMMQVCTDIDAVVCVTAGAVVFKNLATLSTQEVV